MRLPGNRNTKSQSLSHQGPKPPSYQVRGPDRFLGDVPVEKLWSLGFTYFSGLELFEIHVGFGVWGLCGLGFRVCSVSALRIPTPVLLC